MIEAAITIGRIGRIRAFGHHHFQLLAKVTPTEETTRQNSTDSILHEENHFCVGWIENEDNPTNFLHHKILNFEVFKNTK